ncbi:MAG: hypothetical protein Terrestrivirus3_180 [Terrestrivirus sp.]|uniref:Uncharacterized protein n=1 Tax=Terrestrivirus sp. TaxID=2487775 RepID=A0A3G4ZPM0_9VIRU|nr:MAG: hypothetical protein Terrestrivirus3_180 [Terrestrivirus sp.]
MDLLNKIFSWTVCIFIRKSPRNIKKIFILKKMEDFSRYKKKYLNNG